MAIKHNLQDDSGKVTLEEFAEMVQVILHEHELESSIDHKNDEQAKTILSFIDKDNSNSIDEEEFVKWVEEGAEKSEHEIEKFGAKSKGHQVMVQFLKALINRVNAVIGALNLLFGDDQLLSKQEFMKIVLASQNTEKF